MSDNKILTVVIPSYNSQEYLERAVKTTLINADDIEVIIVDDGSTDNTPQLADDLAKKYQNIVRVIHKENGGHGDAVMTGLKNARGMYFKVLDSDDWFNTKALNAILVFLRANSKVGEQFDMVISDYVYDKVGKKKKKRVSYRDVMPVRTSFEWNSIGTFKPWQNILMHSVIYRTKLLRDTGIELPKHTFYVDNIYVYHPLPYVKRMYYLDVDLYHYFIGRDDQSVSEDNMMKRIDQQLLVTRLMIEDHQLRTIENKKLRNYMSSYLSVMMAVSTSFLLKINTEESLAKRDELWDFLKTKHHGQYRYIMHTLLGKCVKMRSWLGRKIIVIGYTIAQKKMGFN